VEAEAKCRDDSAPAKDKGKDKGTGPVLCVGRGTAVCLRFKGRVGGGCVVWVCGCVDSGMKGLRAQTLNPSWG